MRVNIGIFYPFVMWMGLLVLGNASASSNEAPDVLLRRLTHEMISELKEHDTRLRAQPNLIFSIVNNILVPYIDWTTMSQWVVGRNAWLKATASQRARFEVEFKDLLLRTYASTLRAYNNQTIEYLPIRGGVQGNRVQVMSLIRESGREPIRVTYRLNKSDEGWKVYDISIEGVSLLKGFQSQFSEDIQQKGLEKLIERLHQHNEKPLR